MIHLIITGIYAIASFTQGVTGFGFGVLSMPLISLFFSPRIAVGMNALLGAVNCIYNYVLLRNYVQYRLSLNIFFITAAFIPLGAYLLVKLPESATFILMGVMIIGVTLRSMHENTTMVTISQKRAKYILPVFAGMVAGAFAAPGPILAPFMFARQKDPYIAKANLQFIFSLMSILIIGSHVFAQNITYQNAMRTLPFIPIVFAFTKIGSYLSFKIRKDIFKKIEFVALLLLGTYILTKNIYDIL